MRQNKANNLNSPGYFQIFLFWLPLASTWLMMSVEGPFLTAIIARLPEPKFNLAAYGVAYSFALIIEAPIIMIMSASTALVKNRQSYFKLRNFTYWGNAILTLLMLLLCVPVVFDFVMIDLIKLPKEVADLTYWSILLLVPWPGAIGYRRFFQGILIRFNKTRRVAYGTVIRLTSMGTTAFLMYWSGAFSGVVVGAAALSAGVLAEALASRWMAADAVRALLTKEDRADKEAVKLTYRGIFQFYYPLALTSLLGLGVHPVVTLFVGQSWMAIESLAVLPVINALVFIFRSLGLSFQEVAIALMGERWEGYQKLRNFAGMMAVGVIGMLGIIAITPLVELWYREVSGLTPELTRFAILPTRIMILMPALTVVLSFQRSVLVAAKHTQPITWATITEVAGIVLVLIVGIVWLDWVGAVAATSAFILGRLGANAYLIRPFYRQVRNFVKV